MRKLMLALLLVNVATVVAQPEKWFAEANQMYQEQRFAEAVILYDSIVAAGYAHPETFYNLGNAHYRLGNLGLSILNFEKAIKANPADEDAKHNLALANKRTIDQFAEVPTPVLRRVFSEVATLFSSSAWTIIALVLLAFALAAAALFFFRMRSGILVAACIFFLLMSVLMEGLAFGAYQLEQQQFAIVMTPNTYVKSAPGTAATDLFILHEGTKLKVLETFEGWQKVRLPDGKIGWVLQQHVAVI